MQTTSFYQFVQIIERLRKECPWDREQTHQSLLAYLVEETYEVVESIENFNPSHLKEELGDLLLQIVLHSTIAAEKNHFCLEEVITAISDKMVARHPHVFGTESQKQIPEIKKNWEKIKNKSQIFSGIPASLPALLKGFRMGEKASSIGFDYENPAQAFAKVEEELEELKDSLSENKPERVEEELGDLLFALCSYSRMLRINPETCLNRALKKFQTRFEKIEPILKKCDSMEEMEKIWQSSK